MKPVIFRLFFDIVFFLAVFLSPWWISLPLGVVFLFIFDSYYEILFAGLIIDSAFSDRESSLLGLNVTFTAISAVLFLFVLKMKKNIKFY